MGRQQEMQNEDITSTLIHVPSQHLIASTIMLWLIIVFSSHFPCAPALCIKCTLSLPCAYLTSISNLTCPTEGIYITCINPLTPDLFVPSLPYPLRERSIYLPKPKKQKCEQSWVASHQCTSDLLPRLYSSALTFYLEFIFPPTVKDNSLFSTQQP